MNRTVKWMIPLIFLLCTSCRETAEIPGLSDFKPAEKYAMPDLPETAYIMGEDTLTVYPYGGRIYGAGKTLFYRDTATGADTVLDPELPGEGHALYVDENGITLLAGDRIILYTPDGTVTEEYTLPTSSESPLESAVCGNGQSVFAVISMLTDGTYRDCIYHLSRETGEIREMFFPEDLKTWGVRALEPGKQQDEVVVIMNFAYEGSDEQRQGLFRLNADGSVTHEVTYLYDVNTADYLAETDTVYGITPISAILGQSVVSCSVLENGNDYASVRQIAMAELFDRVETLENLKSMRLGVHPLYFFTGPDVYLWDHYNRTLFVVNVTPEEGGQTLTVLYPKESRTGPEDPEREGKWVGYMEGDIVIPATTFEMEQDCRVVMKAMPVHDFKERLRMKLLAGDRDVDIIYIENITTLLPAILNYDLYLPLEDNAAISAGFDSYMDGVRDVMNDDGHLYGIPYKIMGEALIVRNQYDTLGIPEWKGTNLSDFWDVCKGTVEKGWDTVFPFRVFYGLMISTVEVSGESGSFDRQQLIDMLTMYKHYSDAGVISNGAAEYFLYPSVNIPFANSTMEYRDAYSHLTSYPSVDGHQYVEVKDMIFAPKTTENPELAKAYLGLLVSEDFIGQTNLQRSLLLKNPEGYFTFQNRIGIDYVMGSDLREDGYEVSRTPDSAGSMATWMAERGNEVWSSAKPLRYSLGLEELFDELLLGITDGTVTPEEAADRLIDEVSTRLWE